MAEVVGHAQTLEEYLRRLSWTWLVPVALLALGTAGYAIYGVHTRRADAVQITAIRLGAEVDADIQRRIHGLQALAGSAAQAGRDGSMSSWYQEARAYDRTFDAPVNLVDEQRRIVFTSRTPLGAPLSSLPKPKAPSAFESALQSRTPTVGNVILGPVLRQPIVPIFAPVPDTQMAFLGPVRLGEFARVLERQKLPKGWSAVLFDGVGQVIATTAQSPSSAQTQPQPTAATGLASPSPGASGATAAKTGIGGSLASVLTDPHRLLDRRAWEETRSAPFRVMVEVEALEFYRPHLQIGAVLFLSLGLTVLGLLFSNRRASQGLVAAVRTLPLSGREGHGAGYVQVGTTHLTEAAAPPSKRLPQIVEIEAVRDSLVMAEKAVQDANQAARQAEQAERERIAQELHDGLQQDVAVVRLHLDLLLAQSDLDPTSRESLQRAHAGIRGVSHEAHNVVLSLRPRAMAHMGLVQALNQLLEQLKNSTHLQTELEVIDDQELIDDLSQPAADTLYRIAQEALNNVRKHAKASFVHVLLDSSSAGQILMTISDDGIGIESRLDGGSAGSSGLGLSGMAERARALGGELRVERGHHGDERTGTTVAVKVPV